MSFAVGVVLGFISGGVTYALTDSVGIAVLVGAVVFLLSLFGVLSFIFIDD